MKFKCLCGKYRYMRKRLNQKGWSECIEKCPSCGLKITSRFVNGNFGNSSVRFTLEFPQETPFKCNKCHYDIFYSLNYAHTSNELDQITSMHTYCTNCENEGENILGVNIEDLSRYLYIFTKRGKYIYFED